jgi:hypothetical protein
MGHGSLDQNPLCVEGGANKQEQAGEIPGFPHNNTGAGSEMFKVITGHTAGKKHQQFCQRIVAGGLWLVATLGSINKVS